VYYFWHAKMTEYTFLKYFGSSFGCGIRRGVCITPPSEMIRDDKDPFIASGGFIQGSSKVYSNPLPWAAAVQMG
jgi:hypothetical protein